MTDTTTPDPKRPSLQPIERLIDRVARRLRLNRAVDRALTGACLALLVVITALALHKTGWIAATTLTGALAAAAALPLLMALTGWFARLDRIAIAQRIDRAHELHDRLSTALSLADDTAGSVTGADGTLRGDFALAQIDDALRHIEQVDVKRAAPFRRPTDLVPFAVFTAGLLALSMIQLPSHDHPLPGPPVIQHDPVLDAATVAIEKDRLEALKRALGDRDDDEAKELLDAIEDLLEDVENRELSERQFLEQVDAIEAKFFEGKDKDEVDKLAEALQKAAEELKQEKDAAKELAAQKEFKDVVDALAKKDLEGASKALEKLADKLASDDLSAKDAEQLAKLLEKFADKIDPEDPALQELLEKHRNLVDELSKKFAEEGDNLSPEDKQRLKRAQEELDKLEAQAEAQKNSPSASKLRRLVDDAQKSAEKLKTVADERKNKKKERDPNAPDYQNEISRDTKEAARQLEESSEEQKSSQVKQAARKQLEEMREAMKRSQGESQQGQGQDRRGEQVKDFLDRAKGQQNARSDEELFSGNEKRERSGQKGEKEGQQGQQGQAGEQGEGGKKEPGEGQQQGQQGPGQQGKEGKDGQDGEGMSEEGADSDKPSQTAGTSEGKEALGEETSLDSKRVDEKAEGKHGEGESRSEIIKSAAEEGFANTKYKDVYVDYSSVVEEVMEREKVPSGYRYYIKRYFQLIKPQE